MKLSDEQEFELIPMGIEVTGKYIKFSFVSNLGHADVEEIFNAENIKRIQYLSAKDELLKTYEDCISLIRLDKELEKQIEDGIVADVYIVTLETS